MKLACLSLSEIDAIKKRYASSFKDFVDACRSFDALPEAAREFIRFVEARVTRVGWVCLGRRRDQVLAI